MNRDIAILRQVIEQVAKLLAGKGFRVTQQGAQAFVERDRKGKAIRVNLPYIPDNATDDLLLAIQGFLDHEVGHILFTDAVYRMAEETKFGVAKGRKAAAELHQLWNVFEDPMIERLMAEKFPGSKFNLARLHEFFLKKITEPTLAKFKSDPLNQFNVLLVPVARALSGQVVFDEWLTANGYWEQKYVKEFLAKMPAAALKGLPKMKITKQAMDVAKIAWDVLNPPAPPAPPPPSESDSKEKGEKSDGKGKNKDKPEDEEDEGAGGDSAEPDDKSELTGDEDEPTKGEASAEEEEDEDADPETEADAPHKPAGDDPEPAGEDAGDDDGGDGDSGEPADAEEPEGDDLGEEGREEPDGGEDEAPAGSGGDDTPEPDADEPAHIGTGTGTGEPDEPPADDEAVDEDKGDEDDAEKAEDKTPSGAGSSLFSDKEDDIKPSDFADAISDIITDEASREARDAPYAIFTRDFDKIEPYDCAGDVLTPEEFTEFDAKVGHMIGPMQKDIERLMAAKSQVLNVPGYRSGRLHSASLHKLTTGDDRVFRRRFENRTKDTAVSLLMDNSGSMNGAKMETAMLAGYALSQTLERCRIAHEALGFTTGRMEGSTNSLIADEERRLGITFSRIEPLYIPIYKSFGENLSPTVKQRFAHAAVHQPFLIQNVDGESVEIAAQRLSKRPEKRKVLIVLSDGHPAAASRTYSSMPLNAHLHKAVKAVTKAGIEVIGIGIMSDAVKTFYAKHLILNKIEELPKAVMGELKRILTT